MSKPQPGIHLTDKLEAWHEAINRFFPSERDKIAAMSTQLSCSMDIIEFLGIAQDFIEIPTRVKYRIAILLNHFLCLSKTAKMEDITKEEVNAATFPYVQDFTDEILQKRLAYVIQILHDECTQRGLYDE